MDLQTDLTLSYLAEIPPEHSAAGPLMICLHGRGSNEGDLIGLAPYLDRRLAWISPRAPLELMDGYEWFRFRSLEAADTATFDAALSALDRFVAEVGRKYQTPPERTWLLGFSQGSMLAYAFLLSQPARAAGLIAQSGYIPLNTGFKVDEAGLRGKPIFITHGRFDPLIPAAQGQAARDYLQGLGAAVQYREFPMAHNVSGEALAAIQAWLAGRLGPAV